MSIKGVLEALKNKKDVGVDPIAVELQEFGAIKQRVLADIEESKREAETFKRKEDEAKAKCAVVSSELAVMEATKQNLEFEIIGLQDKKGNLENDISITARKYEEDKSENTSEIARLEKVLADHKEETEREIAKLNDALKTKRDEVEYESRKLQSLAEKQNSVTQIIAQNETAISSQEVILQNQAGTIERSNNSIEINNKKIDGQKAIIAEQDGIIREGRDSIRLMQVEIEETKQELLKRTGQINSLNVREKAISEKEAFIRQRYAQAGLKFDE